LLALLCVALFPVARPWPNASAWRGLGLPLLLSGLIWNLAARAGFGWRDDILVAGAWGYALWFGGNWLLPRWNVRRPGWAVAPEFWPVLGLVFVLGGSVLGWMDNAFSLAAALAMLAPYLFLLLRNTAWPGMAWLAVAALTVSGLLAGIELEWWRGRGAGAVIGGCAAALVWLNLLFLLIPLWRRYGGTLARWLGWRRNDLAEPLFWLPFAALLVVLARVWWLEFGLFWSAPAAEPAPWGLVGVALLLAATAGHALKRRPEAPQAHVLLLALQAVAVAIWFKLRLPLAWLPPAVALWDGALLLVWRYGPYRLAVWRSALELWLTLLPAASVALLFVVPGLRWTGATATLFALAAVTLAQGWWQGQSVRLKLGLLLALLGGYAIWLADAAAFAPASLLGLAPWYALQTVLLWLALEVARPKLDAWLNGAAVRADEERAGRVFELEQSLIGSIPWLLVLGLAWLGLHAYAVLAYRAGWGPTPWHFGAVVDPLAAGATLLLLAGQVGIAAWRRPDQPNWVYATALLLGVLAAYGRLVTLGLAPFGVGDTAALMAAAYAVFLLHQFTGSRPLYHLALLLPLLALATVPWQLASSWTGGALLAAAVLYLSLAGTLRNPLPLYLGVLALNGAVYLWAPLWADRYGLWQLYIVPAAVSVLALLHLHRRELRPKVLSGARLAALSALYAGAGLDVFLRPELWIFRAGAGAGFDRHHSRYRSAGARLPVCRRGVSGAERGRATGPLLSRAGHEPGANSDRLGDGHHGRDGGVQPQAGSDHAADSDRARRSGGVGVRTGNFLEAPVYSDQHSTARDGAAESPLHAAVWAGDLDEVRRLVESGADVNWRDSIGETALFGAAAWGRVQAVRYLLSVGARHDFHESNGYTPLHWAAGHGDLETIRILVEAGANAAAPDKLGRLPVDVAHQQGKGSHVAYLKTVGPEIASRRKTRP
jgi:hypothetical protein